MNKQINPEKGVILRAWQQEMAVAKEKPWLASLLMARSGRIFERFARIFRQLAALPRKLRRRVRKQTAMSLAGLALMISLGRVPTTHANTIITVTPGAAGFVANDGCSLAEAIVNANGDAATHPDCPAGNGADTIMLAGNTYTYSNALNGDTALPTIASEIIIEAAGSTIERDNLSPQFRILAVGGLGGGNLTLNNATISGGSVVAMGGGGIEVSSTSHLTLADSTIRDNSALVGPGGYGGGVHLGDLSSAIITNTTFTNNAAFAGGGFAAKSADVSLVDVVISNNNASFGGGVLAESQSAITFMNSTISTNTASVTSGGIHIASNSNVTVSDSTISENDADVNGGGLLVRQDAVLNLVNSTLSGNTAIQKGGGIINEGTLTTNESTLSDNYADYGGGIYNDETGSITLNNTILDNNNALYMGGGVLNVGEFSMVASTIRKSNAMYGGGVASVDAFNADKSIFDDNFAYYGGGVYAIGVVTINNSTFQNNIGSDQGGGISFDSGVLTIENSTFSGNEANANSGTAGGIFVGQNASATIRNSTFTGNSAESTAGGIGNSGSLTLIRSLVSGNIAPDGAEVYSDGTMTSDTSLFGHSGLNNAAAFTGFTPDVSDITATSDGTLPTVLASTLEPTLADNGGPTFTHALVDGSPAIDAVTAAKAPDATCTAGELDQRGAARADGFNQGGAACDLGAYEFGSTVETTAVALRTYDVETETPWLPAAISGLLATVGAWVMRRKYR